MPDAEFFGAFGLYVRRGFLDDGLCRELRREMASAPARPAPVAEADADAVDEGYRRTVSAQVSEATRSMVQRRLLDLKPRLEAHFGVGLTGCQPAQFLRYRAGDYFRAHADHEAEGPQHVTERRVSAVVFLNGEAEDPGTESYSGGALTFFGLMGDPAPIRSDSPSSVRPGSWSPSTLISSTASRPSPAASATASSAGSSEPVGRLE